MIEIITRLIACVPARQSFLPLLAGFTIGVFRIRRFSGVTAVIGADWQGDSTFPREDSNGPRLSGQRRSVTSHNEPDSSV